MSEQLGTTVKYVEAPSDPVSAKVTDEGMHETHRAARERGETQATSKVYA